MPKIMLVEDDNNLREIYGERLMAEGYDIVSASDGEEALALAVKEKPDLIISDVMMPKISGFDMLDILRQTPETKNTKVIMMTALSQSEDKDRADRLGADKYLVKSQVTLEDVARVVHDLINPPVDTSTETTETITQPAESPTLPNETYEVQNTDQQAPVEPVVESTPPATESLVVQPVASEPEPIAVTPAPETPEPINNGVAAEPQNISPAEPITAPDVTPAPIVAEPVPVVTPIVPPANPQPIAQPAVSAPVPEPASAVPSQPIIAQPPATQPPAQPAVQPAVQPYQPTPTPQQPSAPAVPAAPNPTQQATNPITGEPVANSGSVTTASSTADAQTASDELAEIEQQLANFTSQDNSGQTAKHQEPLVEPSEQDLIHAQNATEDPQVIKTFSQPATSTPAQNNPTVPPISPPVASDDSLEPASARKKVINPLNSMAPNGPNIYELYEKEMAKEAADSAVLNPGAGNQVLATSADANPITTNTDVDTPPLETVNVSDIDGIAVDDDKPTSAPQPVATQQPTQVAPDPSLDPNNPNSIAL